MWDVISALNAAVLTVGQQFTPRPWPPAGRTIIHAQLFVQFTFGVPSLTFSLRVLLERYYGLGPRRCQMWVLVHCRAGFRNNFNSLCIQTDQIESLLWVNVIYTYQQERH